SQGVKAEFIFQDKHQSRNLLETYFITNKASLGVQLLSPPKDVEITTDENGEYHAELMLGPKQEENLVYYLDYQAKAWTGKLFIADEPFIVSDQLAPFEWTILPDTKEIAGYNCHAATTHFRGRNYTAYFTPEITLSGGPYKYNGLPGLILEISTEDGSYAWHCKSITNLSQTELAQITAPKGPKPVTLDEFRQQSIAFVKRVIDKIRNSESVTVDSEPIFNDEQWLERTEKRK
ncbi:MAG: GLPGLI family protein, partial [Bacteroidota bacterium]